MPWTEHDRVLHVYAQGAFHEEAYIAGTRAGLERLYGALKAVLDGSSPVQVVEVTANDGEGYDLAVVLVSAEDAGRLPVPYTVDYAQERRGAAELLCPWDVAAHALLAVYERRKDAEQKG